MDQIRDLVFALMDKFEKSRLSELKIEAEKMEITLKGSSLAVPGGLSAPQPDSGGIPTPGQSVQVDAERSIPVDVEIITSPIVGSFYRSPAPDAPAFVEEGSLVKAGDSICIIEAMKIMNKLEAEFSCEIVKILAENGQMIEFGTPLFQVKRT